MVSRSKLSQAILRAADRIDLLTARMAESIGLTPRQVEVIITLAERPGLAQTEISDLTMIDRSTLSGVLRVLRNKKLITRRRSETDERAYQNYLSKSGERLAPKCIEIRREIDQRVNTIFLSDGPLYDMLFNIAHLEEAT